MGTSGGTLGRAKALPKFQARVGAPARSLPGPSLLFPAPPFHGLPALPEGIQPPRAVSRQGKGLKPQRWHVGKPCWAGGTPKRGFRAIPDLLGRAPWTQQGSGRAPSGKGEDLGLIPVTYPQIPALEGLWGSTSRAGALPGQGVARR